MTFSTLVNSLFLFAHLKTRFVPALSRKSFTVRVALPTKDSLARDVRMSHLTRGTLVSGFPRVGRIMTGVKATRIPASPVTIRSTSIVVVVGPFGR